jgi:hypothetical protein
MSDHDGRYDTPHGSTAFPPTAPSGEPLADRATEVVSTPSDQPLADQALADRPTEVVTPLPRQDTLPEGLTEVVPTFPREDTVPAYPAPRPGYVQRSQDPLDDIAEWEPDGTATRPDYRDAPVAVRRADTLAGLLLLLAGIAAGVSLLVVWVHGGGIGLDLVRNGIDDLGSPQRLADDGTWAPLAVLVGGIVLFLLGLLLYVPAKTHRLLGAVALLVALVVAAGVLVPLSDAHWDVHRWAVGGWLTVAVGGLGFLGALKALSTHPTWR